MLLSGDGLARQYETGDAAVLLEQRLLSQTLQVLAGQPTIDPSLLQGSLKGQEPPLPLVTALVDPQKNLSEFWTALGNKLRPSLTVRVTISLADVLAVETAHMVITENLRSGERASPDEESIMPATLEEELIAIGSAGVSDCAEMSRCRGRDCHHCRAWPCHTTDADGRYILRDDDSRVTSHLRVKQPGARRNFPIKVPAPKGAKLQRSVNITKASIPPKRGIQEGTIYANNLSITRRLCRRSAAIGPSYCRRRNQHRGIHRGHSRDH